ncbi:hypothetical protein GXW82_13385 [Streptacidiphilus sp. 4-A2]|nr:hypothetical protein [Streptacidiphilus sp. 4-A2]
MIREGDKVVGVRYRTRDGEEGEIRAALTVAAEGRHSVLRRRRGWCPGVPGPVRHLVGSAAQVRRRGARNPG